MGGGWEGSGSCMGAAHALFDKFLNLQNVINQRLTNTYKKIVFFKISFIFRSKSSESKGFSNGTFAS